MELSFTSKNIDANTLEETRKLLGENFGMILENYIEDTQGYIKEIEIGITKQYHVLIKASAHPLKSSSASLGMTSVYEIANTIEDKASLGEPIEEIAPLLLPLKEATSYAIETCKHIIHRTS